MKWIIEALIRPGRFMDSHAITKYGVLKNDFLPVHIVGGAMLAWVMQFFLFPWQVILAVFITAVLWEVFEYIMDTPNKKRMDQLYGSRLFWFYDTLFDILGATFVAALVVIF